MVYVPNFFFIFDVHLRAPRGTEPHVALLVWVRAVGVM